jgi:hypothetical protein
MALSHDTVVFDVHDFKVYSLLTDTGASPTYGAAVDVPGIAEVSLEPNFVTALLKGDARVIARHGRIDTFQISATYGKVALDVLKVVLGGDVDDAGTTPNQTVTWSLLGDNSLPYFKAEFKIEDLDPDLGDCHVRLWKAQLTGGTLLGGTTDEFSQPTMEISGIPAESNDAFADIVFYETTTALSA